MTMKGDSLRMGGGNGERDRARNRDRDWVRERESQRKIERERKKHKIKAVSVRAMRDILIFLLPHFNILFLYFSREKKLS